jgi:hypothetical protein
LPLAAGTGTEAELLDDTAAASDGTDTAENSTAVIARKPSSTSYDALDALCSEQLQNREMRLIALSPFVHLHESSAVSLLLKRQDPYTGMLKLPALPVSAAGLPFDQSLPQVFQDNLHADCRVQAPVAAVRHQQG